MSTFIRQAKEDIKKDKVKFIVYIILRTFVIIALVMAAVRGEYENVFVCALSLVLFLVPSITYNTTSTSFFAVVMALFI